MQETFPVNPLIGQHGNTRLGHCKVCGNENQNDFYKGKKTICKRCYADKQRDIRQEEKLEKEANNKTNGSVSMVDKINDLVETVNKLIDMNSDKDRVIKELHQKLDIQTALIQQLTKQVTDVKSNQTHIDDDLHEIAEVQQEIKNQSSEPRCNIDEVKRFLDSLENLEPKEYTAKQLEEIADYFDVPISKANNVKKEKKKLQLIQQLKLLRQKSRK